MNNPIDESKTSREAGASYVNFRREHERWRRSHPEHWTQVDKWAGVHISDIPWNFSSFLSREEVEELAEKYSSKRKQARKEEAAKKLNASAGFNKLPQELKNRLLQSTVASAQGSNPTKTATVTPKKSSGFPVAGSYPRYSNAIVWPFPCPPNPESDIRTFDHAARLRLADGPTVTVIAKGMSKRDGPVRAVFSGMPRAAIAAVSTTAAAQIKACSHPPGDIIFCKISPVGVMEMCWFIRDMMLHEKAPAEPLRKMKNLSAALAWYHAGRSMGMDQYLEALQARICKMIAASKLEKEDGVQSIQVIERIGFIPRSDPVFKCAIAMLAQIRRDGQFEDKVFLKRDFKEQFPRIFQAMMVDDIKNNRRMEQKQDTLAGVDDWIAGVEDAAKANE